MNKELEIFLGTRKTEIAPGWTVATWPIRQPELEVPYGRTAYHEAAHATVALVTNSGMEKASKKPGPGYLGITVLKEFNPLAFVAAHAAGCKGVGYDLWVLARRGYDIDSLAKTARNILGKYRNGLRAVASLIEARGTISGQEAQWALEKGNNPEVAVNITNPLGEVRNFVVKMTSPSFKIAVAY